MAQQEDVIIDLPAPEPVPAPLALAIPQTRTRLRKSRVLLAFVVVLIVVANAVAIGALFSIRSSTQRVHIERAAAAAQVTRHNADLVGLRGHLRVAIAELDTRTAELTRLQRANAATLHRIDQTRTALQQLLANITAANGRIATIDGCLAQLQSALNAISIDPNTQASFALSPACTAAIS